MPLRPRALGSPVAPALFAALGIAACHGGVPSTELAQGTLVVVVSTDLPVPKDMDTLSLVVTNGTRVLRRDFEALGPSNLRLPNAFPVSASLPKGTRVHITATAYQNKAPVVLGEADVPFPDSQSRTVALFLSFLCRGAKSVGGISDDGSPKPACGSGRTCRGGACVSSLVGVEDLTSDGSSRGPGPLAASNSCLDSVVCFQGIPVTPVDPNTCRVPLPGPNAETPSVALVPAEPGLGFCSASGPCFIPVDQGEGLFPYVRRSLPGEGPMLGRHDLWSDRGW